MAVFTVLMKPMSDFYYEEEVMERGNRKERRREVRKKKRREGRKKDREERKTRGRCFQSLCYF